MARIAAIVLIVMLPTSVFAQNATTGPSGSPSQGTAGDMQQSLPLRIQQKLKGQGFTDIRVVPEGYVVTAKDRDGDPVTMVIGPHSVAMFTVTPSGDRSSTDQRPSGSTSANR